MERSLDRDRKALLEDLNESISADMPPDTHIEYVMPEKGKDIAMALTKPAPPNTDVAKEMKPAIDLSEWITKDNGIHYYKKRAEDYRRRYPYAKVIPYYLEFGDKYMKAFNEAKPKFGPEGQKWVDKTSKLLREYLEKGLNEDPYMEADENKFLKFVYDTHSRAYTEAGFCNLSFNDKFKVFLTVDKIEFIDKNTRKQVKDVLSKCISSDELKSLNQHLESKK